MQTLAELDLAYLPMEEPGFSENPWPHFAAARTQHPWLAQCAFGYVIHDYVAMKDLLVQDDRMRLAIGMIIQIMGAEGTPWARTLKVALPARQETTTSGCAASSSRCSHPDKRN